MGELVGVEDLGQLFPPLTLGTIIQWSLEGFLKCPPALRLRVGRDGRLIGFVVITGVFEVREQQVTVPVDRIIVDVAEREAFENRWPHGGVVSLVLFAVLWWEADNLGYSFHSYPFTAPTVCPRIRKRCAVRNTMSSGIIERNVASASWGM